MSSRKFWGRIINRRQAQGEVLWHLEFFFKKYKLVHTEKN